MRLPLTLETMESELTAARDLLDRLLLNLRNEEIPGITVPAGPEGEARLADWVTQFSGELMLAARKCENVALTLAEPPGSGT